MLFGPGRASEGVTAICALQSLRGPEGHPNFFWCIRDRPQGPLSSPSNRWVPSNGRAGLTDTASFFRGGLLGTALVHRLPP